MKTDDVCTSQATMGHFSVLRTMVIKSNFVVVAVAFFFWCGKNLLILNFQTT